MKAERPRSHSSSMMSCGTSVAACSGVRRNSVGLKSRYETTPPGWSGENAGMAGSEDPRVRMAVPSSARVIFQVWAIEHGPGQILAVGVLFPCILLLLLKTDGELD